MSEWHASCHLHHYLPIALEHWTDYKISLCVRVSEWVCHTEPALRSTDRNLPLMLTKLASKVGSQEMWLLLCLVEILNISICQTGSGINPYHCSYEKYIFDVRYLENGERYNVGSKWGQTRKHWHCELWPWITLNCPSWRSLQLHFRYFENNAWLQLSLSETA